MRANPKPNELYRHFKGNCYRIITVAKDSESEKKLVVYQALYGDFGIYARELSMFMSPVDREKYPDAAQEMRFEKIEQVEESGKGEIFLQPVKETKQEAASPQSSETKKEAPLEASKVGAAKAEPTKAEPVLGESGSSELDPGLLAFLDADTYARKLDILSSMRERLTREMITTMAIVVDIEIRDGDLTDQYEQLKYALATKERFECRRLR